ncbi:MAG: hypothetical protein ABSD74_20740, partial [Rhizomicrobium sp.]
MTGGDETVSACPLAPGRSIEQETNIRRADGNDTRETNALHYRELKQAWSELTAPGAQFEIETQLVRGIPLRCYKNAP